LPALVVTGVAFAWHRGVTFGSFDDPGYGRLLGIKLVLVVVSIALAAVHGTTPLPDPSWRVHSPSPDWSRRSPSSCSQPPWCRDHV
jgi:hypothetical protein